MLQRLFYLSLFCFFALKLSRICTRNTRSTRRILATTVVKESITPANQQVLAKRPRGEPVPALLADRLS
jgi:hypothetical protein